MRSVILLWAVTYLAINSIVDAGTIEPGNSEVDGIAMKFDPVTVTENSDNWFMSVDDFAPNNWAIQLDLSDQYRFESSLSKVSVEIDGQCMDDECDMAFGIGDGHQYITYFFDFDSALGVQNEDDRGIYIYPTCGGSLANGDLGSLLQNSSHFDSDPFWAVRDAMAGGDHWNWDQFSYEFNDDNWPVTLTVTNDVENNRVTFTHKSSSLEHSCTFSGSFATDSNLTVGILPDLGVGGKDTIEITSISVTRSITMAEGSITPTDYDEEDVVVSFGSSANVLDLEWRLELDWNGVDNSETTEEWGILTELKGDYPFSAEGTSQITVEVDGECLFTQCDLFWGFGTEGTSPKYFTFLHDFDGGVKSAEDGSNGIWIYPECGGPLAQGNVSTLLEGSDAYDPTDYFWSMRAALSGGDYDNWYELTTGHNNNNWPVSMTIINDLDANEVTVRFSSASKYLECVYDDVFETESDLKVGWLSDPAHSKADEVTVESISFSASQSMAPTNPPSQEAGFAVRPWAAVASDDQVGHQYEGIDISFDSLSVGWYLSLDSDVVPDDWAIKMNLIDDYQFKSWPTSRSSIKFTIHGECVDAQCDLLFGIGDGSNYITFFLDFDGGLWGPNDQDDAIWIYPACGDSLGQGDLGTLLNNASALYDTKAVRNALAGGDRTNWSEFSSEMNGNTWPVSIEVTNDVGGDGEVTFAFTSSTVQKSCTFSSAFETDKDLTIGLLPDSGAGLKDDVEIESIIVRH